MLPHNRPDFELIVRMVPQGARVLDVGCGDGELLDLLMAMRGADARGIELSQSGVHACVAKGLAVIQGDADRDLVDYPDDAFDVVILSQTLQATHNPKEVLQNMLRVGRQVIVSLPNFAYWRLRFSFLLTGRMPRSGSLPYAWYDTPNIHLCSLSDFLALAQEVGARVDGVHAMRSRGVVQPIERFFWFWNLRAENVMFCLSRYGDYPNAGR